MAWDHTATVTPVRIVGGQARGRPLRAPAGGSTRPTSDRVREAIFSMLASMDRIDGSTVLDLFAGTGAFGIESVSRGAASAVMVDDDARAIRTIRENLAVLGPAAEAAAVVRSDAIVYVAGRHMGGAPPFDLVFADPPYGYGRWPELLSGLAHVAGMLIAETGSEWDMGPAWETVKVKRYGGTVVSVAQPSAQAGVVRAEDR
ncbi:MAG: 16S rRNA (guanine(966)-N(2))-methyltransferase RsmD [Acidimicrobiales bacterium]|nr:16S rRNA (guanine(966)-N(2))-methyltransferase RsmD [Acidimicrobiales bacterium]